MDRGRIVDVTVNGHDAVGTRGRVSRSLSRSVSASRHAPVVEIIAGEKSYRQRRLLSSTRHDVHALSGVELRVERGSTLGLAGPSGCGKSTLARCLAGLEPVDAGKVLIDGHDITSLRGRALLPFRNRVQMIFQDAAAALNPRFTRARARHRADGHSERRDTGRAAASSHRAAVAGRPPDQSTGCAPRRVQRRRASASGHRSRAGCGSEAADSGRGVLRTRRRDARLESRAC